MDNQSSLFVTPVPRSLESKNKIFGLELSDILILFLNLSIQNLIFGSTQFKVIMVYGTTLCIGFLLFFVKRGRPDHYIQHFVQYVTSPSVRFAGLNDRKYRKLKLRGLNDQ